MPNTGSGSEGHSTAPPALKVDELDRAHLNELWQELIATQNAIGALSLHKEKLQVLIDNTDLQAEKQIAKGQHLDQRVDEMMKELQQRYNFTEDMIVNPKTGEIIPKQQASEAPAPVAVQEPPPMPSVQA